MAYIPLEDLAKSSDSDSYFKLVLMAAERANEILEGSNPLVKTDSKRHTTIALQEVLAGKVKYTKQHADQ